MNFSELCESGNLEEVRLYLANIDATSLYSGFIMACKGGHINIAQILFQQTQVHQIKNKLSAIQTAFCYACEYANIHIAKWLLENEPQIKVEDGFTSACFGGHLHIAQWFIQTYPNVKSSVNTAFTYACEQGHINIAQWLLFNIPPVDVMHCDWLAFKKACTNGHFRIAKWLYAISMSRCHTYVFEYSFRQACENGHLRLAQWLFKIVPNINILSGNMQASFNCACSMGYYRVVWWLLTLNKFLNNKRGFELAVANGHLRVAQLLFKRNVNDVFDLDHAFRMAGYDAFRMAGYFNGPWILIIQWLQSINPFKYHYDYNNNQYSIHSKKELNLLCLLYGTAHSNHMSANIVDTVSKYL